MVAATLLGVFTIPALFVFVERLATRRRDPAVPANRPGEPGEPGDHAGQEQAAS
jgi:hypothetical protein